MLFEEAGGADDVSGRGVGGLVNDDNESDEEGEGDGGAGEEGVFP
jgi:hypothetical protein